jgi:hypothetical protein
MPRGQQLEERLLTFHGETAVPSLLGYGKNFLTFKTIRDPLWTELRHVTFGKYRPCP